MNLQQAIQPHTYWEQVATTRWGEYISAVERKTILRANEIAHKPSFAVELGCDGGRWSKLLADSGWQMTCTDINDRNLQLCRARIPSANCILVEPEDNTIPCVSASMGMELCIEVVPVIQSEWFVSECNRVLNDKGLIVGVFWNSLSVRGIFSRIKAASKRDFQYYNVAYVSWRQRLFQAGFEMIFEEGFCWFPFPRNSDSLLASYAPRLEHALGLSRLPVFSPWISFIAQRRTPK